MTSPDPCTAVQRSWDVHIARKGQSLPQSEAGAWCGQHGMSSGMPIAASSAIAVLPLGKAIAGRAIGTTARPMIARKLSKRPIPERLIIPRR
jgi:hypothetical protein